MKRPTICTAALGAVAVFLPLVRVVAAPVPAQQDPGAVGIEATLGVLADAERRLERELALLQERMAKTPLDEVGTDWVQSMADRRAALQAQRVQLDNQRAAIRVLAERVAQRRANVEIILKYDPHHAGPETTRGGGARRAPGAAVSGLDRANRELAQAEAVLLDATDQLLKVIAVGDPSTRAAALGDLSVLDRRATEEYGLELRHVEEMHQRVLQDLDAAAKDEAETVARRRTRVETDFTGSMASLHRRRDTFIGDLSAERARLGGEFARLEEKAEKMAKANATMRELAKQAKPLRAALQSVRAIEEQIAHSSEQFDVEQQELTVRHQRELEDLVAAEVRARDRMVRSQDSEERRFQALRQRLEEQLVLRRSELDGRRLQLEVAASRVNVGPRPVVSAPTASGEPVGPAVLLEMRDSVHELREGVRELRGLVRDIDRIVRGRRKAH